jgi:hypothetical protein
MISFTQTCNPDGKCLLGFVNQIANSSDLQIQDLKVITYANVNKNGICQI